jgi:hypothetical protein
MEHLKFSITVGRTVNLGDYNSMKAEFSSEFYQTVVSVDEAFKATEGAVLKYLASNGINISTITEIVPQAAPQTQKQVQQKEPAKPATEQPKILIQKPKSDAKVYPCKYCGADIKWGKEDDKNVPFNVDGTRHHCDR